MKRGFFYFTVFILIAAMAMATSYSGPVRQTVCSADGKFCAVIDPGATVQNVYKSAAMKKVYWSFIFLPEMDTWFVPDNGDYVVCVRWKYVRVEDLDKPAVTVFWKDGSREDHSFNSLVKARKTGFFETAPRGSFWRVWCEGVKTDNNRVEIFTHDRKRIVITGDDGSLKIYQD